MLSAKLFEADGETFSVMTIVDEHARKRDEAKATAFRVALRPPTTTGMSELVAGANGSGPIVMS